MPTSPRRCGPSARAIRPGRDPAARVALAAPVSWPGLHGAEEGPAGHRGLRRRDPSAARDRDGVLQPGPGEVPHRRPERRRGRRDRTAGSVRAVGPRVSPTGRHPEAAPQPRGRPPRSGAGPEGKASRRARLHRAASRGSPATRRTPWRITTPPSRSILAIRRPSRTRPMSWARPSGAPRRPWRPSKP